MGENIIARNAEINITPSQIKVSLKANLSDFSISNTDIFSINSLGETISHSSRTHDHYLPISVYLFFISSLKSAII